MSPLYVSMMVGMIATILIVVTGILLHGVLKVYMYRGRSLIDSVITLPLVLPPVVMGFFILMIFSPANAFGAWLDSYGIRIVFTKMAAILASAIVAFPLFYQSLKGGLEMVDPVVEYVARTLGASEWRIYWTISLPLAKKALVSGGILAFCRALGEFGATILVAGNIPGVTRTLPLAIYTAVESGNYVEALDYVVIISALTICLLWVVHGYGNIFGKKGRN